MAWQLIDGLIANDAFATPASAGTSALVDGINNQSFATPASATAQPVDAVMGLTTWTFSGGGAVNYTLAGTAGAYAVTGRAGTFKQGHTLTGSTGSYAAVGQAATFKSTHSLVGASGGYSMTGNASTLAYTPGAGSIAHTLSGLAGSYSVTGGSAGFKVARVLLGAVGSYALTGNAGALAYTPGSGVVHYALAGSTGAYSLFGFDAGFAYSGAPTVAGGYDDDKPKKKRYIVEKNGKLFVYGTAQEAIQNVTEQRSVPKQIPAKKKKQVVKDQFVDVKPIQEVDLEAVQEYARIAGLIEQYNAAYNSAKYEALISLFEQMRDEEDIETLLLSL
jgi:hypothetical protein